MAGRLRFPLTLAAVQRAVMHGTVRGSKAGGMRAPTMKYPFSLSVLLSRQTIMPYCGHSVAAVCPSSCHVRQAQFDG